MDQLMVLPTDRAVDLIGRLSLVTPDIFDHFLMALMSWYQEESNVSSDPPNVFALLDGKSNYSRTITEIFVEGFARRYSAHHQLPHPASPEFTQADMDALLRIVVQNWKDFFPLMVADVRLALDFVPLNYVWDELMDDTFTQPEFNSPLVEVW